MKKYLIVALISCACLFLNNVGVLIAQNISWERMKGPTGGWILSIAVHLSDDIYAGTYLGGIYKSTNDGASWNLIGLYDKTITSIAINSQGIIFAGTSGDGIYRSKDNGVSWVQCNSGLTNLKINVIGIAKDNSLYAGSDSAIYRSTNNGDNWIESKNGLTVSSITKIAFAPQGYIYIGTDSGLFRSTNDGMIWSRVDVNGIPGCSAQVLALGINANGDIFVRFPEYPMQTLAFRSTDGGITWQNLGDDAGGLIDIKFNSQGNIIAGGVHGVDLSTDNGDSWAHTFIYTLSIECIALNSKGYIFGGTIRTGIYRSIDGGNTFAAINNGLNNMSIHSFLTYSQDSIFVGTKGNGLYYSYDDGGYWYSAAIPDFLPSIQDLAYNYIIKNSNGLIIASNLKTFLSSDGGSTWKSAGNNADPLVLGQLDHLYTLLGHKFFISNDNGASWKIYEAPSDYGSCIAVQNSKAILISSPYSIYKSFDEGFSWINLKSIRSKYTVLYNSNIDHIFAASDSIVIRSTDDGNSWTQIGSGLQHQKVSCFLSLSNKKILAGTSNGIYISFDNGDTFQVINDGLLHHTINILVLDAQGYVDVGTEGGGMFRSTNKLVTIPPTPNFIYPLKDQRCVELAPIFKWNSSADAFAYQLQISEDSLFQGKILFDSTTTDTTLFIPSVLVNGKTYYYMVRSINSIGIGAWNLCYSFTTAPIVLFQPVLMNPPDNAVNVPQIVQFDWNNVDCAQKYLLQVSTDSTFQTNLVINDSTIAVNHTIDTLYGKSKKYYWRTSAQNSNSSTSLWSTIYSFSTEGITNLNENEINVANHIVLSQNYPNPFTTSTTIHYTIPKRDHVILKVFDCLGREVATLVDEGKEAGEYKINLAFSKSDLNLRSGIYFYQLKSGREVIRKKMISVK